MRDFGAFVQFAVGISSLEHGVAPLLTVDVAKWEILGASVQFAPGISSLKTQRCAALDRCSEIDIPYGKTMASIRPQILLFGDSQTEYSVLVDRAGWGASLTSFYSRKVMIPCLGSICVAWSETLYIIVSITTCSLRQWNAGCPLCNGALLYFSICE